MCISRIKTAVQNCQKIRTRENWFLSPPPLCLLVAKPNANTVGNMTTLWLITNSRFYINLGSKKLIFWRLFCDFSDFGAKFFTLFKKFLSFKTHENLFWRHIFCDFFYEPKMVNIFHCADCSGGGILPPIKNRSTKIAPNWIVKLSHSLFTDNQATEAAVFVI